VVGLREKIVEKLNAVPFNPDLEFTQEEIEYMLKRYVSTHTRSKVGNIKLHHYIDDDKEKIGLKAVLNNE
jgi:mRNA-degrading endonuclease RelE of RelBE toxin-antitoxin system